MAGLPTVVNNPECTENQPMATEYETVGNYLTEDTARQAEDRLREAGIDDVDVANPEPDLWRVRVANRHRDRALDVLRKLEEEVIKTHGPG